MPQAATAGHSAESLPARGRLGCRVLRADPALSSGLRTYGRRHPVRSMHRGAGANQGWSPPGKVPLQRPTRWFAHLRTSPLRDVDRSPESARLVAIADPSAPNGGTRVLRRQGRHHPDHGADESRRPIGVAACRCLGAQGPAATGSSRSSTARGNMCGTPPSDALSHRCAARRTRDDESHGRATSLVRPVDAVPPDSDGLSSFPTRIHPGLPRALPNDTGNLLDVAKVPPRRVHRRRTPAPLRAPGRRGDGAVPRHVAEGRALRPPRAPAGRRAARRIAAPRRAAACRSP
jgi:hypothetical protein